MKTTKEEFESIIWLIDEKLKYFRDFVEKHGDFFTQSEDGLMKKSIDGLEQAKQHFTEDFNEGGTNDN